MSKFDAAREDAENFGRDEDHRDRKPNMIEAIQAECNRVRERIAQHEVLPGGVGVFGVFWMKVIVRRAEQAIADSDAVECVGVLQQLRDVK